MKTLNKNERIERALNGITESCGQLMMWMRQFELETGCETAGKEQAWRLIDGIARMALDYKEEGLPF